jgi:hypothetical protein
MASIQLALHNRAVADELRRVLAASTTAAVECVERPDLDLEGVVVVDPVNLERLPQPIGNPERVVLITRDDPGSLRSAWEAGVNSVVFDRDPLNTVVLAILSACLRSAPPGGAPPAGSGRP